MSLWGERIELEKKTGGTGMQFYRITGKFNKKTKGDAELLQNSEPAEAGNKAGKGIGIVY